MNAPARRLPTGSPVDGWLRLGLAATGATLLVLALWGSGLFPGTEKREPLGVTLTSVPAGGRTQEITGSWGGPLPVNVREPEVARLAEGQALGLLGIGAVLILVAARWRRGGEFTVLGTGVKLTPEQVGAVIEDSARKLRSEGVPAAELPEALAREVPTRLHEALTALAGYSGAPVVRVSSGAAEPPEARGEREEENGPRAS